MVIMNKKYKYLLAAVLIFTFAVPQANAFWGAVSRTVIMSISKNTKVLHEHDIIKLSKLSNEVKGTQKVGRELSRLRLPNDVLEDTFLRIAIYQNKLSRSEAEQMFVRIGGTPGFRQTLRKVIGNNAVGTIGHLNELKIADSASKHGFNILGIGYKFNDGVKKSLTDVDVLIEKEGKTFAVEAKSYAVTTKIPMDKYRSDLDTLLIYKKQNHSTVIPVFTITNKPINPRYLKQLQYEADKRGVQLLFGSPQEQVEQMNMLAVILCDS